MVCVLKLTGHTVVASIEETAERYHIPKAFIGLILLPIVANAAEHVTSVWMAMKDKMELTITICVGSSIVRFVLSCICSCSDLCVANCVVRCAFDGHHRVDYWPRAHSILRRFRGKLELLEFLKRSLTSLVTRQTICLFVSVILVNTLIQDGKSNYMEGLLSVSLTLRSAYSMRLTHFQPGHSLRRDRVGLCVSFPPSEMSE